MTCDDVRTRLLDYQRGRLPLPIQVEVSDAPLTSDAGLRGSAQR